MEYKVYFMARVIDAVSPQEAVFTALDDAKKFGGLMVDEVVDSEDTIQMSSDYRRVGKKWSEK